MSFEEQYFLIKETVNGDLDKLEDDINSVFFAENPLNDKLKTLINSSSKRLRPLIAFLFLRASGREIDENQYYILSAVELIHNATLIHDDVIDNSDLRRNQKTIHKEFDNNLAVIAGDFLLSVALKKITAVKDPRILELFAKSLESMCLGEISQYFNKFKIPTIDDYIEKSTQKTAFLFETAISASIMAGDGLYIECGKEFAKNFGIAFQVRDDLLNFISKNELKPSNNDVESGIYTAPVIFSGDTNDVSLGIVKTKNLMDNYFDKCLSAVKDLEESKYKTAISELVELLKNAI